MDTETTGLSWYWDEIVELGLLLFAYDISTGRVRAVLDEYSGLREPACPVTPGAYEKHRLAPADLKGHSLDEPRIASVVDRADIMISHNVEFDLRFWQKHFPMLPERPWVCSMEGIPWREWGAPSPIRERFWNSYRPPARMEEPIWQRSWPAGSTRASRSSPDPDPFRWGTVRP